MNILAVGAHWDDIELGCGLTLKRLADNGHKIFSVVVCSSLYGKNENFCPLPTLNKVLVVCWYFKFFLLQFYKHGISINYC